MTWKRRLIWGALGLVVSLVVYAGVFVLNLVRRAKTQTLCAVTAGILERHASKQWEVQHVLATDEELLAAARRIEAKGNTKGLVFTDSSGAPLDPWDRKLIIRGHRDAQRFTIEVRSIGRDGIENTTDDITGESVIVLEEAK